MWVQGLQYFWITGGICWKLYKFLGPSMKMSVYIQMLSALIICTYKIFFSCYVLQNLDILPPAQT